MKKETKEIKKNIEIKKEIKQPKIIKRKENVKAVFSFHSGRYNCKSGYTSRCGIFICLRTISYRLIGVSNCKHSN